MRRPRERNRGKREGCEEEKKSGGEESAAKSRVGEVVAMGMALMRKEIGRGRRERLAEVGRRAGGGLGKGVRTGDGSGEKQCRGEFGRGGGGGGWTSGRILVWYGAGSLRAAIRGGNWRRGSRGLAESGRGDQWRNRGGDARNWSGRVSSGRRMTGGRRSWRRRRRRKGGGGGGVSGNSGEVLVAEARSGSGRRGGGGGGTEACGGGGGDCGWTPSPAFREQPLEMEETPFFSQMMARVCGGVPSSLIEPKMG